MLTTRLADILEKQYQDSHDLQEENLGKWDDKSKKEFHRKSL